ncbi:helix-turn-helix transcriptional regulator [Microcoleus sp. N3A4]|uniref:helix-turn-helix transcriptional regulator n=1 Tax=Microcoleus sp. N3A4 TaxID=3055379 RepID=UPI002FD034FD
MSVIEQLELAELVRQTWQRLELSQVKFAKKLGVCFQSVNRWENGRTEPLPVALKQIDRLLHQMGDRAKIRLAKYFSARGLRIYDF